MHRLHIDLEGWGYWINDLSIDIDYIKANKPHHLHLTKDQFMSYLDNCFLIDSYEGRLVTISRNGTSFTMDLFDFINEYFTDDDALKLAIHHEGTLEVKKLAGKMLNANSFSIHQHNNNIPQKTKSIVMKKILFSLMMATIVAVIVSIPDATDRLIAVIVFSMMGMSILLAMSWPWLKRNRGDILFCLLLPWLGVFYIIQRVKEKVTKYNKVIKFNPEDHIH